jgi:endonuclease/exonuclease/phosphatase (EEP) superfamily protein YafD
VTFSILFWNVWYLNQVETAKRERLLSELKHLAELHRPDSIALAETVKPSENSTAPIIEYLRTLGYTHSHCANMAQLDDYWMSGVAICSKLPISQQQRIVISKNGFAIKQGYENLNKEVICAQIALPKNQTFHVIVAHPTATIDSPKQHRIGKRSLDQLVRSQLYSKNTIMVGDMNEWRLMPGSLRRRVSDVMNSRTGSIWKPTWRYNARRLTPLRLNLDYVYWSKGSDFCLKDFRVLPSTVSDHRPLLSTFEYNTQDSSVKQRRPRQARKGDHNGL